jgi:hypothetical protein
LCLLVAGLALAQPKTETKTKHVTGAVKSIAAEAMVVTVSGKDWDFVVDENTNVLAKGASHTSRKAEGASEATMITDFVKAGQTVTVDYHEMGGKLIVNEVRVK